MDFTLAMDSILTFVLPLLITIAIELPLALIIFTFPKKGMPGFQTGVGREIPVRKIVAVIVALNLLTNPATKFLLLIYEFLVGESFLVYIILEIIVVLIEAEILRRFFNLTKSGAFFSSLIINLFSLVIGTLLFPIVGFLIKVLLGLIVDLLGLGKKGFYEDYSTSQPFDL